MEKTFGGFHLIYLFVSLCIIIVTNIILKKKKVSDKTLNMVIKIEGIIWLICIILNRVFVTYNDVIVEKRDGYTFLNLIPNTFCGLCSLVLSFTVIFGKKDNFLFHSLGYLGFVGGLVTMLYPDFLDSQNFFDPRSITGLLHHTFMFGIMLKVLLFGYMKPSIAKWSYFILGLCTITTIGVVELDAFGFKKAMQIGQPLISSLPILTSWYVVYLVMIIAHFIFLIIYEKTTNKITLKEIFAKLK